MAYLDDLTQEQLDQQKAANGGLNTSGVVGSTTGGASTSGTPAVNTSAPTSSGWTNLDQYLTANQGAGAKLA
ncbi:hypothetical protein ACXYUI_30355, partial [Klebsiella pneumoniae]